MKKIMLYLLLPASLAFGQEYKLIPDFKPQNLPVPLGNVLQQKGISHFPGSEGQLFAEDSNRNMIQAFFDVRRKSMMSSAELEGRFSFRTYDGSSVYRIQPDHMACLVPDLNKIERMPYKNNRNIQLTEPMPIAGPKLRLIPQEADR